MAKALGAALARRLDWLEPLADAAQRRANALLTRDGAPTTAKSWLNGVWLGHPLHPALTDVPIGAWTMALMLDGVAVVSDSDGLRQAADATLAIGVAGALGAAASGAADWSDTQGETRRIGLLHAVLNSVALGLNLWSLLGRRRGHRGAALALSVAGYAIASVSASIGGELVFRRGIGVSHQIWPEPPQEFTPVISYDALADGRLTRARAGDVPVCLLRRGEQIVAVEEWCTHLGGPLSEGQLDGTAVTCPWHGSRFDLESGEPLNGPATAPLRRLETRLQDGRVEVRLPSAG
ncbi:MAG TPA: Rieske 2Fe-2S domain-containing protein [Dehalococcoidia bacterium]|jgi:nitrite reductase/ring-hydroxylating ferredoxin subunit/uncharacterized membrane protein